MLNANILNVDVGIASGNEHPGKLTGSVRELHRDLGITLSGRTVLSWNTRLPSGSRTQQGRDLCLLSCT